VQIETLRGVRKAQIKLATFYLLKGATGPRAALSFYAVVDCRRRSFLRDLRRNLAATAATAAIVCQNDGAAPGPGETGLAMTIRQDMADEPADRLESIKEELLSVQTATFWELEDRGYNFEYLTGLLTQGFLGVPQDPFTPRRGPLGPSPDKGKCHRKRSRTSARTFGSTARPTATH
jgi:hypothetical protein